MKIYLSIMSVMLCCYVHAAEPEQKQDNDVACTQNADCKSDNCADGTCAQGTKKTGESCTSDNECTCVENGNKCMDDKKCCVDFSRLALPK